VDINLTTIIDLSNVLHGVSSVLGLGDYRRKIITINVDFAVDNRTNIHITDDHMRYFLKKENIKAKFETFQGVDYRVYVDFDNVRVFCLAESLDKFKPYMKLEKTVSKLVAQRDMLNAKIKASQEAQL